MLFDGYFDLSFWELVVVILVLTHITIASVTIFLHRCQAHRALELHPLLSHLFRFWLWLTTGMVTKEWAAIHRKHHAKCETVDDPHSPQILGLNKVLWLGVFLYVRESFVRETIERYGHGTPDDWIERNLYSAHSVLGLFLMGAINIFSFGLVPGLLILAVQIIWIPFWAAGVINGIGHFWGYRSWQTSEASTNIIPWGIWIGGEELHNNHHAFATSAKLSSKWYEFDIGWMYIRILEILGLATVKKVAPKPKFTDAKPVDLGTLEAVIANRYEVLAKYAASLKATYREELAKLKGHQDATMIKGIKRSLTRDEQNLADAERARLAQTLNKHQALRTAYNMRNELKSLWDRSHATSEQLLRQLQDWCHRAEASGIRPLQEFSFRLRCYA
ncbi:MAG: acyl-CoA desaturase [Betaproteobacteria bacterium]|nr:acyl-CoA desaturase [Betaproteobacteria bacterium]